MTDYKHEDVPQVKIWPITKIVSNLEKVLFKGLIKPIRPSISQETKNQMKEIEEDYEKVVKMDKGKVYKVNRNPADFNEYN